MAARCNYIVLYKKTSQVYSASTLETAVKTQVPKGCTKEDRRILFTSFLPDEQNLCVFPVSEDKIAEAEDAIEDKKKDNGSEEK